MEPTPPRKPKENRPFYAPLEDKPTSVQIINEARSSLKDIKTKRPFTPREDKRTLFGPRPVNSSDNRPPSAFSLDSRHFDPDSRPVSGTRLSPLDHKPSVTTVEEEVAKLPSEAEVESLLLLPKPPNDPNKTARKNARQRIHHANSVDVSGQSDATSLKNRSHSLSDVSKDLEPGTPEAGRRTHSGPKERTLPVEERGEGDGIETPPRAPSSIAPSPPSSAVTRPDVEERLGSGGSKRSPYKDSDERIGSGGSKRISSGGSTGREGSAGKRDEESAEDANYYSLYILPVLEDMATSSKNKDAQKICSLSDELYNLLERQSLLSKNYKQRSRILKAIFRLLDLDEPKLLLRLARLILAFRVSGNNLLNVCRLVFKVSRNEKNDPAFLEGNILDLLLETLGSADIATSQEALIYCTGALKFLTGNATIAKQLVKKECVERLSGVLDSINKTTLENGCSNEQLGHVLVQLTAALRNLADANTSRDRIINCRLLDGLCMLCDSYAADAEIILNVSRIFSKVTLHTDCCTALSEQPMSYKVFLHLLKKHLQKEDIVVRVCFILGNMTAKNDDARIRLYQETKSLDVILSVLKTYLSLDIKTRGRGDKRESTKGEGDCKKDVNKTEDVLIKVVRVIANISINDIVGPQVASSHPTVEQLLNILDCKDVETSEELVLTTVACINNLSYFHCKTSALTTHQIRVVKCLMKLVLSEHMMKSIVEVSRVFGNLTRQKQVRDYLTEKKVDRLLITLLDSGDKEVVYIACGVLINFMVDEEKRAILKQEGGITKLVEVLRDFGRGDWELAGMVCQTLWNYSGKITSTTAFFGDHDSQELIEILVDFLDKENAFDPDLSEYDGEFQDYIMETWDSQFCPVDKESIFGPDMVDMDEEYKDCVADLWETSFCPVGKQLLHRLEENQSDFEALPEPEEIPSD